MIIENALTEAVEAKLENPSSYPGVWNPTITLQILPNKAISLPLSHSFAQVWIRPFDSQNLNRYHAFSSTPIGWPKVTTAEVVEEIHQCHSYRDKSYR